MSFSSPRGAAAAGIGTVYQDLALQPRWRSRNFFLGRELSNTLGFLDFKRMDAITREEMAKIGIDVADPSQPIGTMLGQRQTLAIARAIYFGAKILILDEPTQRWDRSSSWKFCAPSSGCVTAATSPSSSSPTTTCTPS